MVVDGEGIDIVGVGVKCEVNFLNHFLIQFLAKSWMNFTDDSFNSLCIDNGDVGTEDTDGFIVFKPAAKIWLS